MNLNVEKIREHQKLLVAIGIALLIVVVAKIAIPNSLYNTSVSEQTDPAGVSSPRTSVYDYDGADLTKEESYGGESATPTDDSSPSTRLIIKSGTLGLTVDNVSTSIEDIQTLTESLSGFVTSSQVSSNQYPYYPYYTTSKSDDEIESGTITIRVPADRFDEAITHIKSIAEKVDTETITGQDVTEEYTDLNAQISNYQKQEERLLELYSRSGTIEEILKVEKELTRVRGQIESLQGRVKYLEQSAKLSSITVTLTEKSEDPIITDEEWTPITAARKALRDLVTFGQNSVDATIYFLIRYGWLLLITYAGFIWYKRRQK